MSTKYFSLLEIVQPHWKKTQGRAVISSANVSTLHLHVQTDVYINRYCSNVGKQVLYCQLSH